MLKEGKERICTYIVMCDENGKLKNFDVLASSAQQAVNYIRNEHRDIIIINVAKVVNNWK